MLHRHCFLLFLAGFSSPSHAQALRGKKGKGVSSSSGKGGPLTGSPQPGTECGTPPPSLTGGCDLACDFIKAAEASAEAVVSEIPGVGNFVSNLVGAFWPSGPDGAGAQLEETLKYIDSKLAIAESESFLDDIKADYRTLVSTVNSLNSYIQQDESGRLDYLRNSVFTSCTRLNSDFVDKGLNAFDIDNMTVNPISLLTAVGSAGQVCLAMRTAEIYHYNSTIGGPPPSAGAVNVSKTRLNEWVQDYTIWAQNATQQALAWRMSQISSQTSECSGGNNDDGGDACSTETFQVASITDSACFAAGGPPTYMGSVIADSSSQCACDSSFSDFVAYYQSIVMQSFTDNLVPISRSLVPLWQYQTSENMDAGIKPSPVIRAATSLIDAFIKVDLREADYAYTFPAAEMAEIYNVYNGPVSQGQRTDRITQVNLWMEEGTNVPLRGVAVSQVVGGQSETLQIGQSLPTDDYNSYSTFSLTLEDNERIVAVGTSDCGDPNFQSDGTCLSLGYAFKTAYVNATGAFESEGRLWNPMNYPEDAPWIVAPPLAQSRNDTFLPYVIAFHGWVTNAQGDISVGAKVPVWLYESLE